MDLLDYTLLTDKRAYKLHEPVELTVSLTNKTDRELSFKAPRGYGSYFGVQMTYPHGGTVVSNFEHLDQVFPADPVVIAPGESFRCTRIIEPDGVGIQL